METNANLSLAHEENSQVFVKVSGVDEPTDLRSTLSVASNGSGECWIGFNGYALLEVLSGGLFTCRVARIGNGFTGDAEDVDGLLAPPKSGRSRNWGRLPKNLQTEIRQGATKKPHPEYTRQIKRYFEKIAQPAEDRDRP